MLLQNRKQNKTKRPKCTGINSRSEEVFASALLLRTHFPSQHAIATHYQTVSARIDSLLHVFTTVSVWCNSEDTDCFGSIQGKKLLFKHLDDSWDTSFVPNNLETVALMTLCCAPAAQLFGTVVILTFRFGRSERGIPNCTFSSCHSSGSPTYRAATVS